MRYPASEKLVIIRLVEQSYLPIKQTLDKLGIPRTTFYRWCERYQTGGPEALEDQSPHPSRVWNRIPDDVRQRIVDLALDVLELSPRELAVRFTDTEKYFVSEASVYRLLKPLDLVTSPAFIFIKAADEFRDKTTAINQLWQTDFTYFKVIGWGWMYLSTILDDYSRYIIAWKLCTTMKTNDVTDMLTLPCRHQAAIRPMSPISRDYYRTRTPAATSLASWLSGWATKIWGMSGGRRIIHKVRAGSNDGIKP